MRLVRYSFIMVMMMCILITVPAVRADGTSGSGTGGSNPFLEGLMGILEESIDEFIGSYKGSLGEVMLLERRGNRIVLEVTYDNVKRSDNVFVQGEVLHFGEKLEGFSNTLSSISGSHGKAKLMIGWSPGEDDGWETQASQAESDQIRLFLVRESNPDRPFGQIMYDMSKIWTDSDEPDEEEMSADSGGIELEDEPDDTGEQKTPSIFVKPGTVLKPYKPAAAGQVQAAGPSTPGSTAGASQVPTDRSVVKTPPAAGTVSPLRVKPVTPMTIHRVQQYDFYKNAGSAKWRSRAGALSFPGAPNDPKGFVRLVSKGTLNSGNAAVQMLYTHPQKISGGWIEGRYPLMILDDNLHFKAVAGFLKGADNSDGAVFQVYINEGKTMTRAASVRVRPQKYIQINADLSKWAGKKVQVVLRVRSGKTSERDLAVWVKPRLTK